MRTSNAKKYTDSEIVERTERYMESMSDAVSNLRGLIEIVTHIVEHDIDDRWIGVLYFLEKLEEDFRDIYGGIGYGLHYRQEQNTKETKPYVDIGKIAPFIKEAKKEINRSVADKLAEATGAYRTSDVQWTDWNNRKNVSCPD